MGSRIRERPVTIFCFAGRRGNMEIQLPYIRRILAQHPEVEYHIWNLARNDADREYLETIEGERIWVLDPILQKGPDRGNCGCWMCGGLFSAGDQFNAIYQHYTQSMFSDRLFVKIDDDVVFIETAGWDRFVDAIDANRGHIVTAKVINNGACTATIPGLWDAFEELSARTGVRLGDVYRNLEYGEICHAYMFEHWRELLDEPFELLVPDSWLSINTIGYDWEMGGRLAGLIGTTASTGQFDSVLPEAPEWVTDDGAMIGDEGAANILPRLICQGFLTAHLSYAPQRMPPGLEGVLRKSYANFSDMYLRTRCPA